MNAPLPASTERSTISNPPICPYLGTHEDPDAWFQFPSSANYCYRTQKPQAVDTAYQHISCLTAAHTACVVYKEAWKGPLPEDISGAEPRNVRSTLVKVLGGIGIVLLLVVISVWILRSRGVNLPFLPGISNEPAGISQNLATATPAFEMIPTEAPATETPLPPTETPSPTPAPSATPTPTIRPTIPLPTPGPDMGTPFGPQQRFLLHTVQESEALSAIARLYNTNVEVIKAANMLVEGASVWPGKVLVLIPGETDPTNVIKFCAFRLEVPIKVQELADLQGISPDDIRFYNVLGADDTIPAHRWLIFPSQNILDPKQCR